MLFPAFIHPVLWLLTLSGLSPTQIEQASKISRTKRYFQGYQVPPDKEQIYRELLRNKRHDLQEQGKRFPEHQRLVLEAWLVTVDNYLESPQASPVLRSSKMTPSIQAAINRMTKGLLKSQTLSLTREELYAISNVSHVTFYKALNHMNLTRTRLKQRIYYSLPET